jgi:hypothetical protein
MTSKYILRKHRIIDSLNIRFKADVLICQKSLDQYLLMHYQRKKTEKKLNFIISTGR